jgi:hypothetical protein
MQGDHPRLLQHDVTDRRPAREVLAIFKLLFGKHGANAL